MFFFLLLILPGVRTQDPAVTNYSPRQQQLPFNTVQFLQHKQARKGPILFPNDAPPPPPTPLIVTSRPLSESIARSELNPNNTLAAQSQYHQVTYRPSYLARGKNYEPYSYTLATVAPVYDYEAKVDYSDNERTVQERKDNFYKDYELRVVKPLYTNNVQRQQNPIPNIPAYKYKDTPDQFYHNKNNEDERDYNQDNSPADNYAFSYTVKDQKTGDDFSHSQKSTGSATNGEYRVRLPDGRMQIVSYTADENGYKADVRYDEQHNQDNSIDTENHRDGEFRNNIAPTYKYNDRLDHQDSFENEEYLQRPLKAIQTYKTPNNYEQAQFENINDYGNKQDNLRYYSVHPTKSAYTVTTAPIINDHTFDDLSDNNKDYLDHNVRRHENNDKLDTAKNDYKFSDEIIDYSSELDQTYQPHKSKFSAFADNQDTQAQSQVRPSYEELKDLFVTNVNGRRDAPIPVVSTIRPVYAVTTDNIVAITPRKPVNNLYTNIKNIASASPTPFLFSTPSPVTPKSYLLSTIANLKHQISLNNKPVLSDHYINKINKYLTYSNPSKISK